MIVGDLGDATVVTGEDRTTVTPDADMLSELGEAVDRVVRADEAPPFAAIAVGASLVRVDDGITPVDGIAALTVVEHRRSALARHYRTPIDASVSGVDRGLSKRLGSNSGRRFG